MKIYVPSDKVGPILVGSNEREDFEQPPGYDVVYLRGAPQITYSSGAETAHARESAVEALRLASSNEFSDIYFNRSFSTINDRMFQSLRRPDVVGVARPTLDGAPEYQPYEILSPRQTHEEREDVMPRVSGVRRLQSRHYRMLLKLLHALLFKLQR